MLTFLVGMVVTFIFIEGMMAFISLDSFGDHLNASILVVVMIFGSGWVVSQVVETEDQARENSEQAQQLQEQVADMDDVIIKQQDRLDDRVDRLIEDVIPKLKEAVQERRLQEERPSKPIVVLQDLQSYVMPTNTAHIDKPRRRASVVLYDALTKRACMGGECFGVKLVQHSDGSPWACKRNYGSCYQYEMK